MLDKDNLRKAMELENFVKGAQYDVKKAQVALDYVNIRVNEALDNITKLRRYDNPLDDEDLSLEAKNLYKEFVKLGGNYSTVTHHNLPEWSLEIKINELTQKMGISAEGYHEAWEELKRRKYVRGHIHGLNKLTVVLPQEKGKK